MKIMENRRKGRLKVIKLSAEEIERKQRKIRKIEALMIKMLLRIT